MKLTNEQKGYNFALKTGISVMEAKINKNNTKLSELQKDIEFYEGLYGTTIVDAKLIVLRNEIMLREAMNKQLLLPIEHLKSELL